MNPVWEQFLASEGVASSDTINVNLVAETNSAHYVYPLSHLSVLRVTGADAAKFLQGQITCNVQDITPTQSSLGAFCNPKGRVITTFLLVQAASTDYLLVLPAELLEAVKKRLQMYVLRAPVKLLDESANYCVIGLRSPGVANSSRFSTVQDDKISINFPGSSARQLLIAEVGTAMALWQDLVKTQNYLPASTKEWRYLDLLAGIPWLDSNTSEHYIPQMLNLDDLGGISFNKGCYTGQEVVARTHYLGHNKRRMYLAAVQISIAPTAGLSILDENQLAVGKVVTAMVDSSNCKMLVILQTAEVNAERLYLDNAEQTRIVLLAL